MQLLHTTCVSCLESLLGKAIYAECVGCRGLVHTKCRRSLREVDLPWLTHHPFGERYRNYPICDACAEID